MKVYHRATILALFFCAQVTAFSVHQHHAFRTSTSTSPVVLRSTSSEASPSDALSMFPLSMPMRRIEGGNTLLTYQMPPDADRVQMVLKTNGRPMKAFVQLWLGPLRQTHGMQIDLEDGNETPFMATLKFKKGGQTLKIATKSDFEFPLEAGVAVASPERSDELDAITQSVWETSEHTIVQGGGIEGGGGAVRTFPIPNNVESVQVLVWSKNVGKKSLKAKIEVLQGPNNVKQEYDLQCGGGSQPYHAIFQTPGKDAMIRIKNKKYVEDGKVEVAIVPYVIGDPVEDAASKRQWWE